MKCLSIYPCFKHNIANLINKRCGTNRDNHVLGLNNDTGATDLHRTFRGGDISSLVAFKIENGN